MLIGGGVLLEAIEKLSDFMCFIENLPDEFLLSRGQPGEFNLLPSALRKDPSGNRKYSKQAIQYFLDEFQINAPSYIKNGHPFENEYEWMIYAQHYGIPTRMLDFTFSHVISLMFAVENAFDIEEEVDSEVWFLNPEKLNTLHASRAEILNIANGERFNLDRFSGPVAVKSRKTNERIKSQNGLFVYFQDDSAPLNELVTNDILKKVIIKGEYKKQILASLFSMGISFTTLYPELQSVSKDIILKQSIQDFKRNEEE